MCIRDSGNYDNTPAAKVAYETVYEGDEAILRLRGEVREACVFEENMLLTLSLIHIYGQVARVRKGVCQSGGAHHLLPLHARRFFHAGFQGAGRCARRNGGTGMTVDREYCMSSFLSLIHISFPACGSGRSR